MLAAYMADKKEDEALPDFLSDRIFISQEQLTEQPDEEDVKGFGQFMRRYREGMDIEYSAIKHMK